MGMEIIARSVELIGNLPDVGEREGGPSFRVTFEVNKGGDDPNEFALTFMVNARKGVAEALDLARERLVAFIKEMKLEASEGDLGHGPRRLF